ncbi:outer membrane protein assembly factor BamD [Sphingomonas glaciei]|uniref:Outer membrane protein assembly factor BamD n=1 Tax=Sphingomonas glaciei TaxID=2938948 RepID=A0ABY5MX10_9SPHN|nr:outer membrane protein assembly factor BamD [Sphingomonas glaciei]UUR06916.1 outer membrane protein assembly factor BamD [Sphingomonas glaciei]
MPKTNRLLLLALSVAVVLPAAGCARNRAKSDTAYVARDVNTLYALAKGRLDKGDYTTAAKTFDEVERQHPYSVWARRAQLMSAFSYYMAKTYPDAISSAQRFLTIHPGNKDAPYANYLIAMSYYNQIADVTRDQKITTQASDSFQELIRRYPESRYAADARLKQDLINDQLAGKEMEVGRYYQRSGNWLASVNRFREVVDKYQTTTHAPEALMRLTESYLALGTPDEAVKSAAVLGRNYPGTVWYERAYALIQRHVPNAPRQAA